MKLLHLAAKQKDPNIWIRTFVQALQTLGDLKVMEHTLSMPEQSLIQEIQRCDILLTGWGHVRVPDRIAVEPGNLKYICNITGEMRRFVSEAHIKSDVPVTNWGDAPANAIAEGAMVLLLAMLKDLHRHIMEVRKGGRHLDPETTGGSLRNLQVGLYGCGVIGQRFVEMLRPFGSVMRVFDPYAKIIPEGCVRVGSLEELFKTSQAIVIHAGHTHETRRSVTKALLAELPDHAIVINTARGGIIDQEALFEEVKKGRLRAGLDVLEPDRLDPDHPARQYENLIWTGHHIGRGWPQDGKEPITLNEMHEICLDNINRFLKGEPLRFVMDPVRFARTT